MTTHNTIKSIVTCLLLGLSWLAVAASAASVTTYYQYDNAGQVVRQRTETAGQAVSDKRMQYDELGRVKVARELASPVAGDAYSDADHDDANDRVSETAWDVAGNVELERRAYRVHNGQTGQDETRYAGTTYTYDGLSRKTGMTNAEGHTTVYHCDNRGNIEDATDPEGNFAEFVYDAAGQPVLEKRYEGLSALVLQVNRVFDNLGHKVIEIQGDGQAGESFEQALPTALTQQRWQYDALDRLTKQAQLSEATSEMPTLSLNPADERITRYTYVGATKHPWTHMTYGWNGGVVTQRLTTFEYDGLGRPQKIIDPNGNTDEYTYVPIGQNGEGKVLTRTVTSSTSITDPAGVDVSAQEFSYTYDWQGRKETETAKGKGAVGDRPTRYYYDDASRMQRVTNPKGTVTEYYSNVFGDQVKVIEDANGLARTTEMHYDQLGRMDWQKVTNTGGQIQQTDYAYDLLDHRTRIEFPDDGTYTYVYDNAGRLEQRTDPREQVTTYTNNWRGQPFTKTVKLSATAPAELKESFTYYPTGWAKAGWMDTASESAATNKTVFQRDAFGQATAVTQTVDGVSKTVGSQYYPCGDRKQLAYPADVAVTLAFTQDGLGQTTEIKRNGTVLATYGYAGRKVLWRDILTAGASGTHVRWEAGLDIHRQQGRLTNRTVVGTTSNILDQTDYTYDLAGNRQTAVVSAGDKRLGQTTGDGYGYDNLDRLISAAYPAGQSETFHYDLLGNRTSSPAGYTDRQGRQTSYTANEVNQYTSINGVPLATGDPLTDKYDAAGNLLANEHGYQFVYDYENRLVEVKDKEAGHTTLASYTYDALGHRVKQVKDNQTTRYYYDGETVLAEYDAASGSLLRYHIHGPTYVDEHVVLHEQAHGPQPEAEYYYLLGPLYSVTGLVNASGAVVERYRYDAYGLPTRLGFGNFTGDDKVDLKDFLVFQKSFSGNQPCTEAGRQCDANGDGKVDLQDYQAFAATVTGTGQQAPRISPFLFTGQPLDFLLTDASGRPVLVLQNSRYREYDAYHGRFLQKDPAALEDTDVVSRARAALAKEDLRRALVDMVRQGLTRGPWALYGPLVSVHLDPQMAYAKYVGATRRGWPTGLFVTHLDGLNLYQYARSNPLLYCDPDGRFTIAESILTVGLSAMMGGLSGGLASGANAFIRGEGFLSGFASGFAVGAVSGAVGGLASLSAAGFMVKFAQIEMQAALDSGVATMVGSGFAGFTASAWEAAASGDSWQRIILEGLTGAALSAGGTGGLRLLGNGIAQLNGVEPEDFRAAFGLLWTAAENGFGIWTSLLYSFSQDPYEGT